MRVDNKFFDELIESFSHGTTLTLDAEITMVRSPEGAQRNPGIGTEATTVFPGMRCAPSGPPISPSFGASAVFPVNGAYDSAMGVIPD
jgi:hypothetical protein